MSRHEFTTLQKSSNVVWMPTPLGESDENLPAEKATQTYYRSQAFTAEGGANRLIACAYPLLTLVTRLRETTSYSDLIYLNQTLLHEIRVFENQALASACRQSTITIACYFLCVLLDETIIHSTWGKAWQNYSLLASLHHEELSKERAFHIMDRLLQHPSQHLDALELAYFCLSFGLKNPNQQNPSPEFLEKLDKIYRCIREERGEISQGFLVQEPISPHAEVKKQHTRFSLSLVTFLSISIAMIAYGGFCYGLKGVSTPLAQEIILTSGN